MEELVINLFISGLLFFLGVLIKYFKVYDLIAGYNTSSKEEKEYMAEKGIGDYVGRQLMIMAPAPLVGYFLVKAGFKWGIEIGIALFMAILIYTLIGARRFNPPPSFYTSEAMKGKAARSNKISIIGIVISIVVTVAVFGDIIWTAQPPQYTLEDNSLKISGAYGTVIPYSNIEALELKDRDTLPSGTRTNALGMGSIQKGHYKLEGVGKALLFLRSDSGPMIVIQRKGKEPVMINFTDAQDTEGLYGRLKAKLEP